MKNKISIILRLMISFGLLGLLFWLMRHEIYRICSIIAAGNIKLIFVALLILMTNSVMLAHRLKVIFRGEDLKLTFREALQLTYIGYFFNNFMPSAVGGDIVKAHYASCANKMRLKTYASVFMDRIIGLYTFLLIAAVALIIGWDNPHVVTVKYMVFILVIVGATGFIMVVDKRIARLIEKFFTQLKMFSIGEKLKSVYNIVHDYRNRLMVVLEAAVVSVVSQLLYFSGVYLLFVSLGTKVGLGNVFLIMPIVSFAAMIPSLGGLGVREGAIVAFFSSFTGKEAAFAVSLLVLLGLLIVSFIGGGIYLWWGISGIRKEKIQ